MSKESKPLVFGVNYETIGKQIGYVRGDDVLESGQIVRPVIDSIILTRSELKELLDGAWQSGKHSGFLNRGDQNDKDKQQYIDSILKNNQP